VGVVDNSLSAGLENASLLDT